MTYLALYTSHYVNGVAKKHREVSQHMFAGYKIDSITNGVHVATWACPEIQTLFDKHISGWRQDNLSLRYGLTIAHDEIWKAHSSAKERLLDYVNRSTNAGLDRDIFTVGFARRATQYKRLDLVFHDLDRLRHIAANVGQLQLVFGGKAHPHDMQGKELIQNIFRIRDQLHDSIRIIYLPEYDMTLGKLMTAGVDLWLNTPQPPMEASGTSGMKAAVNGVPSLSILDGWWIEGCIEGITGWAIGHDHEAQEEHEDRSAEAANLYDKLEQVILPLYYNDRDGYINVMRQAIALNGSFFNTERMVDQYVTRAYFK
jgi:starch phosphorylase